MTSKQFLNDYVNTNTPCFMPGMAKTMDAYYKWNDTDYMVDKIGHHTYSMER